MRKLFFFLAVTLSLTAFAKGEGTVMDLKWPFVNFLLLFSFLGWKIRPLLKKKFDKQAEDIARFAKEAEEKSQEAKARLHTAQERLSPSQRRVSKHQGKCGERDGKASPGSENSDSKSLERLDKDFQGQMNHLHENLQRELKNLVLNSVIKKAQARINQEKDLRERVATKLLSSL